MLTETSNYLKKRIFLRVANGKIVGKLNNQEVNYGSVTGAIKEITVREHEFNDEKFKNWHILMEDLGSNEEYDLAFSYTSGAFVSVIRCLITQDGLANLDNVCIKIYTSKTGYTNAVVDAGKNRLHWSDEPVPEVKKIIVDGKTTYDNKERLEWLESQVEKINSRSGVVNSDDLPEDFNDLPDDI